MPTYEYECPACKSVEEIEKHLWAFDIPEHCDKCGAQMERIITSPPAFVLKGTGWAKDGYSKNTGAK